MTRRRAILLSAAAVVVLAMVALYAFVPPESGFYPRCVFKGLTGYDCPGCGMQRMFFALLHGDFGGAFAANPLLLCALPVLGYIFVVEAFRERWPRLYRRTCSPPVIALCGISVLAWGVLRNLG